MCVRVCVFVKVVQTAMCAEGNSCLGACGAPVCALAVAHKRQIPMLSTFSGSGVKLSGMTRYTFKMSDFQIGCEIFFFILFLFSFVRIKPRCQDSERNMKKGSWTHIKTFCLIKNIGKDIKIL